ncbi:unnamed protein product [Ranitomeya imitator]|uniref:MICOS complex subunit n=1 Tax=Ranitomeya imitator TaxID=111125 RepID=A0ABN9KVK8_9NEOB|nr:unnamed protein product [Ranitomeya imitator]
MWLNKEVRQAINSKKKAFALLKQDGTIEALKNYREKNTLSKKLIKAVKKETEKHIAKESKTNPKLFFNYINSKRIKTENVGPLKNSEERMVVDDEEKANILNTFFSTVFTVENEMLGEIPRNNENPILRVTNLTQEEVRNRLNKIKIDKSPGPDGIHPRVLRELTKFGIFFHHLDNLVMFGVYELVLIWRIIIANIFRSTLQIIEGTCTDNRHYSITEIQFKTDTRRNEGPARKLTNYEEKGRHERWMITIALVIRTGHSAVKFAAVPASLSFATLHVHGASETKTPPKTLLKVEELSLYSSPVPETRYVADEKTELEEGISWLRSSTSPYTKWCQDVYVKAKPKVETAIEHSKGTYEMLRDAPPGFYPRLGLIGFAGIVGLFLARGSRIKKVIYPLGFMGIGASLYYPQQAATVAKVRLTCFIGNFLSLSAMSVLSYDRGQEWCFTAAEATWKEKMNI